MPTINANGATLYYDIQGSGYPLVLIAGYTCDHTFWDPLLHDLSQSYQVVIFDNRGAGQTKDAGGPLSVELMADDVMVLCQELNLKKPHMVGQSMGGAIAQIIATRYPEKINKLGILTSSSKLRENALLAFESLLFMRKINCDFDLIFNAGMPWIFGEEFLKNKKNVANYKQSVIANPHLQTLEDQTRQFHLLQQFDSTEQLKHIHAPTLIIYGTQDIVSLPRESAHMASIIPKANLAELNCAHGMVNEVPQQLLTLLREFL